MYKHFIISLGLFFCFTYVTAQTADDSNFIKPPDSSLVKMQPMNTVENTGRGHRYEGQPYKIKPLLDIPLTAAGVAWTLYGFSVVYNRDSVTAAELATLDRNNVNSFDRGTTKNYNEKIRHISDQFFYGSMPLPLILLFDKKIRKDAGRMGLMYLETMAVTGTIYTICAMSANRFRPYAYNTDVPLSKRTRGGSRNSFFAGHPSIVGTSTFFMASVYSAYHPEMKNKWILYTIAGAATATTALLRVKAGQHFPTDALIGVIVGPTVGLLVPHFHRNRAMNPRLSFMPHFSTTETGVTAYYKL
jgi:membrane-associated phospholipid phosphatase